MYESRSFERESCQLFRRQERVTYPRMQSGVVSERVDFEQEGLMLGPSLHRDIQPLHLLWAKMHSRSNRARCNTFLYTDGSRLQVSRADATLCRVQNHHQITALAAWPSISTIWYLLYIWDELGRRVERTQRRPQNRDELRRAL